MDMRSEPDIRRDRDVRTADETRIPTNVWPNRCVRMHRRCWCHSCIPEAVSDLSSSDSCTYPNHEVSVQRYGRQDRTDKWDAEPTYKIPIRLTIVDKTDAFAAGRP